MVVHALNLNCTVSKVVGTKISTLLLQLKFFYTDWAPQYRATRRTDLCWKRTSNLQARPLSAPHKLALHPLRCAPSFPTNEPQRS